MKKKPIVLAALALMALIALAATNGDQLLRAWLATPMNGNQQSVTNLTAVSGTNAALNFDSADPTNAEELVRNSVFLRKTDTNGNQFIKGNYGGGANMLTNIAGSGFGFGTMVSFNQGTNFVIDLTNVVYPKIAATNNLVFLQFTNAPGSVSIKIRPGGADRLVFCPTNWICLNTNGSFLWNTWRIFTLTNANGMGWLSVAADGPDPTNAVYNFSQSGGSVAAGGGSASPSHYWTNLPAFSETFSDVAKWGGFGTATFSHTTSNTLHIVGGAGNWMNVVSYTNWVTAAHSWTLTFDMYAGDTNVEGFIGPCLKSVNAHDNAGGVGDSIYFGLLVNLADAPFFGMIQTYEGTTNSPTQGTYTVGAAGYTLNVSPGQPLHCVLTRRNHVWNYCVSNTVNSSMVEIAINTEYATGTSTNGFEPSSAYISFFDTGNGSKADFDNVTFTLDTLYPVDNLLIGDSITSGYGASVYDRTYPAVFRSYNPSLVTFVTAAPGDDMPTFLMRTNEIKLISAQTNVIVAGVNDIRNGTALATIESNYGLLVGACPGSVFKTMIPPCNSASVEPFDQYIRTNYPTTHIDAYFPMYIKATTQLKSFYSFDGTHLSDQGYSTLASLVYHQLTGK